MAASAPTIVVAAGLAGWECADGPHRVLLPLHGQCRRDAVIPALWVQVGGGVGGAGESQRGGGLPVWGMGECVWGGTGGYHPLTP